MGKQFQYDVVIIGSGVSGSAVARELSRYQRNIAVLERESDVCEGTSKANSGIVHAGYDAIPGTLKAKLNVLGSKMMEALSKTLDFPYKRIGSFVVTFEQNGIEELQKLYQRGIENGVEQLELLSGDEARKMDANLSDEVKAALYAPTAGIVCPFGLNLAMAENAAVNGADFYFNTKVMNIEKNDKGYQIITNEGNFFAPIVVNAAGVYADAIHNMVTKRTLAVTARKGEYCLFDEKAGDFVKHIIFQLPTKKGKGVLVTPTVHGNLLVGPTAKDVLDKESMNTTAKGLDYVLEIGGKSVKTLPKKQVITSFSGLRAQEASGDFVIEEVKDSPGFFDVAGIASPGLSSAPAIGIYVAEMIQKRFPVSLKDTFIETRKGIPNMAEATMEERKEMVKRDSRYANVICRCELVTEGEIIDAIHRPLGAKTLDGVKRRTRAGMGRCQAGFCSPKTAEILARELEMDLAEITKSGKDSYLLTGYNKKVGGR